MFPGLKKRRQTALHRPPGDLDIWANSIVRRSGVTNDRSFSRTPRLPNSGRPGNDVTRTRTRSDQPVVSLAQSSSRTDALAAALSDTAREAALQSLDDDVYAKTSLGPQVALLKTWRKFHVSWFMQETPVFPITIRSLRAVSAMFKAGRYSSFKNYLYAAKGQHLKLGHQWTQALEKIAKDCIRSVMRGVGPAKRSLPVDADKVMETLYKNSWNQEQEDQPVDGLALFLTGIFFMAREIELSGALQYEASANVEGDAITLTFPASKKDTEARGTTRTVDCLCGKVPVCPSHYLSNYLRKLESWREFMEIEEDLMPLFPNPEGRSLNKDEVVRYIRNVVVSYDHSADLERYTGHTFRITGARYYSDLGLDPITIGLHGRWSSNAIMTYLAEAPLSSIRKRLGVSSHQDSKSQVCFDTTDMEHRNGLLGLVVERDEIKLLDEQEEAQNPQPERAHLRGFVLNTNSRRVHVRRVDSEQTHNFSTMCGWKWAGKDHVFSCTEMPTNTDSEKWVKCPKCFPDDHKSSSSESDTSTSESSSSDS